MNGADPLVVVLDDDPSVLRSLKRLLESRGYRVRAHLDPDDFFRAGPPSQPACLLLDQDLGKRRGTEVHAELRSRGWKLKTVFLTADGSTPTVVDAMRGGAENYLTKPFDPADLLDEVARCLGAASQELQRDAEEEEIRSRAAALSERERAIVSMVIAGMLNKEIADRLQLALVTIKLHRGTAMRKLGAGNAAELARIAALAGIEAWSG